MRYENEDSETGKPKSGYRLKFEEEGNKKYRKQQNEKVIKRE